MAKIRDLGISNIPFAQPARMSEDAGRYWMCNPSTPHDPETPMEDCRPTRPKCHPSLKPKPCNPSKPKGRGGSKKGSKKKTLGLPDDAVMQLREQLRQKIGSEPRA